MARRAARDLLPLPRIPSVELRDEHRALGRSAQRWLQRRHHLVSLENEVVDALNSLAESRQARAAFLPFTLAKSCSLKAVVGAVALAGHRLRRWPRSPVGASGCSRLHRYTSALRSTARSRSGLATPTFSAKVP